MSTVNPPTGWYASVPSPNGFAVYTKMVRKDMLAVGGQWDTFLAGRPTRLRVIFNGWMGGWVIDIDRQEGKYLMGGAAFPSAVAAMVAAELELSNN
jgi:hypothetical protein